MRHQLETQIENSILAEDRARLNSRVHKLRGSFSNLYVKRDDELSFQVSGSKLRKLLGIKKLLLAESTKKIVIIGGLSSNHMVSSLHLARELNLEIEIWTLKSHNSTLQGNRLISELLIDASVDVKYIDREQWDEAYPLALKAYADEASVYVLNEGANQFDALLSSMTLALEISEWANGEKIDLWLEVGTGLLAQAVEIASSLLALNIRLHLIMTASSEKDYCTQLERYKGQLAYAEPLYTETARTFHKPVTAKSFGATNQKVFKEIKKQAVLNGMLVDPIYGAKSLLTIENYYAANKASSCKAVWVHGGGAMSVFGFTKKLESILSGSN